MPCYDSPMNSASGRTNPQFAPRYITAVVLIALTSALAVVSLPSVSPGAYPDPVPLRTAGVAVSGDGGYIRVTPGEAVGASYLPGSSVLILADGSPLSGTMADARRHAEADRAWLREGKVPAENALKREIATRSLLNLKLLTGEDGASIAAPDENWDYVWPRDASWVSAAFAATSHERESRVVLDFLSRVQSDDGTFEARYETDGSPVTDGRPAQLDGSGWFVWAVWFYGENGGDAEEFWPAVRRAADVSADSLGRDGLPPGGADYWEIRTLRPNLGTSAALLVGLRSATELARDLGHDTDATRYEAAADRLQRAVDREFAPNGYTRTPWPTSGRDAAVTFLAPPFAPLDDGVLAEVWETEAALIAPNGGIVPGERWPQEPGVSWTAESAFFMLSAASSGDEARSDEWLRWLAAHRTGLGAFPEKVDTDGSPKAASSLTWTHAAVLLTLAASEKPLPVPPAG